MINEVTQNKDRYTVTDKEWKVSATSSMNGVNPIIPITGIIGTNPPNLVPALAVDGIVVLVTGSVGSSYLVSPTTLQTIKDSKNPHYSIVENGMVKVGTGSVVVGKTIPIISVNIDGLILTASQRDIVNKYADVKSVEYIFNGSKTGDVPDNLINQINYTLSGSIDRPEDKFDIWNLGLSGDYSIETLKIETTQNTSGSLDKAKLQKFLIGVNDRLQILRKDFNSIKDTFYNGVQPTQYGSYTVKQQAIAVDTQGDIDNNNTTQVNIVTSQLVSVQPTPTQQAIQQSTNTIIPSQDDLITKWNSYGFTDGEKQALINNTPYTEVGIYDKIGTKTKISDVLNLAKDINALQITTGKQY